MRMVETPLVIEQIPFYLCGVSALVFSPQSLLRNFRKSKSTETPLESLFYFESCSHDAFPGSNAKATCSA